MVQQTLDREQDSDSSIDSWQRMLESSLRDKLENHKLYDPALPLKVNITDGTFNIEYGTPPDNDYWTKPYFDMEVKNSVACIKSFGIPFRQRSQKHGKELLKILENFGSSIGAKRAVGVAEGPWNFFGYTYDGHNYVKTIGVDINAPIHKPPPIHVNPKPLKRKYDGD